MHGGMELMNQGKEVVDTDQVKGTIDEISGRAKRQIGEWTGDTEAQIEGLAQEVKGKAEKAWGGVKHAARSARDEARRQKEDSSAS